MSVEPLITAYERNKLLFSITVDANHLYIPRKTALIEVIQLLVSTRLFWNGVPISVTLLDMTGESNFVLQFIFLYRFAVTVSK